VLNSFRQVGGSLGIALMGAILASYITVSPRSPEGAQQFVNGLHAALLVSAAITFAAAVVAVALVRTRPQVVHEHIAELAA
jgi:Na+/melibiose symporter-like transporter